MVVHSSQVTLGRVCTPAQQTNASRPSHQAFLPCFVVLSTSFQHVSCDHHNRIFPASRALLLLLLLLLRPQLMPAKRR
jgi:hypothetical protein